MGVPKRSDGIDSRYQAGCHIFNVALRSCELARKKDARIPARRHCRQQNLRRVDVGVSMNLSEPKKLSVLQTGNHPEDALLLGKFQVVLESNDVVARLHQVFLPKLHDGVWR